MKPIFDVEVIVDEIQHIQGDTGEVTMILFHGNCKSDIFQGKIIPGGVDTQIKKNGESKKISARYILKGRDYTGKECQVFIENNGVVDTEEQLQTKPVIYTDSEALKWLEKEKLRGYVCGESESHIRISIFRRNQDGC